MEQYLQTMAQLLAEAAEETTEVAKRLLGMMDADKTVISTSVADHEVETEFDGGTGDEEAGSGVEAGAAEVVEAADAAEAAEAAEVKVAFEAGCVLEDDSEESTDVEGKEGEAGGAGSANLEFEVALPAGSKLGIGFTHNDTHATHGKIGCKVTTVQAESAAAKSGKILPHDWLLAVNGTDVSHDNKQGVIRVIKVAMASGEPVTMRFRREAMDAVSKVSARGEEGREEDDMEIVVRCLDTGEQHDVQHLNRQVMSARKHSVSRIHQETAGLAEAASLFHRFLSISDFGGNRGNRGTGPHDADAFWPSIPHRRRRVLENHEGTGGGERGEDSREWIKKRQRGSKERKNGRGEKSLFMSVPFYAYYIPKLALRARAPPFSLPVFFPPPFSLPLSLTLIPSPLSFAAIFKIHMSPSLKSFLNRLYSPGKV